MRFVTREGRLLVVAPERSVGDTAHNPLRDRTITVDDRPAHDVLEDEHGRIVVEIDGTESRWRK